MQYSLYYMALKPRRRKYVYLLDPLMLKGKESAQGWRTAIATLPPSLRSQIDGFVSDNLAGMITVADEQQWVHPEFEEPRHTLARSRRKIKENQGDLLLFCHET